MAPLLFTLVRSPATLGQVPGLRRGPEVWSAGGFRESGWGVFSFVSEESSSGVPTED